MNKVKRKRSRSLLRCYFFKAWLIATEATEGVASSRHPDLEAQVPLEPQIGAMKGTSVELERAASSVFTSPSTWLRVTRR